MKHLGTFLLILSALLTMPDGNAQFFFGQQGALVGGESLPQSGSIVFHLAARLETGYSDNDSVSSATDQSVNGNNFVQATGSKQPIFKTGIINSLPVYRFDGTDDSFGTSSTVSIDMTSGVTVMWVVDQSSVGMLVEQSAAASLDSGIFIYGATLSSLYVGNAANEYNDRNVTAGSGWMGSAPTIFIARFKTDPDIDLKQDGAAVTLNSLGQGTSPWTPGTVDKTIYLGGRNNSSLFMGMDLAEIVYWNVELTDDEVAEVFDTMNSLYETSLSPSEVPGLWAWLQPGLDGYSDTDAISSLTDYSGNGHGASQGTGSLQPVYDDTTYSWGMAVADGTDDYMTLASSGATFGDFYVVAVFVANVNTVTDRLVDKDYANGFWIGWDFGASATTFGGGVRESSPPYGRFVSASTGTLYQLQFYRSGTTHTVDINGSSTSGTVSSSSLDTSSILLFADEALSPTVYGAMQLGLLLIYDNVPSASDRTALMQWVTANFPAP